MSSFQPPIHNLHLSLHHGFGTIHCKGLGLADYQLVDHSVIKAAHQVLHQQHAAEWWRASSENMKQKTILIATTETKVGTATFLMWEMLLCHRTATFSISSGDVSSWSLRHNDHQFQIRKGEPYTSLLYYGIVLLCTVNVMCF